MRCLTNTFRYSWYFAKYLVTSVNNTILDFGFWIGNHFLTQGFGAQYVAFVLRIDIKLGIDNQKKAPRRILDAFSLSIN